MLDENEQLLDIPIFTVNQAATLLHRFSAEKRPVNGPIVFVFVLSTPSSEPELQEAATPAPPLPLLQNPRTTTGLQQLGKTVFDHLPKLVTYYLIGCAYRDGAKSLRDVAEMLRRRRRAKALPTKGPTSASTLSKLLLKLTVNIFAKHLKKPHLSLLSLPEGEGRSAVLGVDGWKAWEATRDYLSALHLLPIWPTEAQLAEG